MQTGDKQRKAIGAAIFVSVYLALQLALIVRAHTDTDKRLGFWMFAEASYFQARLFREMKDGTTLEAKDGIWIARGPKENEVLLYSWDNLVNDFNLDRLSMRKKAKTGMAVTLKYLQAALNFVAKEAKYDTDTKRFGLEVEYTKAGSAPTTITLFSDPRL